MAAGARMAAMPRFSATSLYVRARWRDIRYCAILRDTRAAMRGALRDARRVAYCFVYYDICLSAA